MTRLEHVDEVYMMPEPQADSQSKKAAVDTKPPFLSLLAAAYMLCLDLVLTRTRGALFYNTGL